MYLNPLRRIGKSATVIVALIVTLVMPLPAVGQGAFPPGTIVSLVGTPHLWVSDDRFLLHWVGDTRALQGRDVNWTDRRELTLDQLRRLPQGDPWLSAGLLKRGDPIYLVKWERE